MEVLANRRPSSSRTRRRCWRPSRRMAPSITTQIPAILEAVCQGRAAQDVERRSRGDAHDLPATHRRRPGTSMSATGADSPSRRACPTMCPGSSSATAGVQRPARRRAGPSAARARWSQRRRRGHRAAGAHGERPDPRAWRRRSAAPWTRIEQGVGRLFGDAGGRRCAAVSRLPQRLPLGLCARRLPLGLRARRLPQRLPLGLRAQRLPQRLPFSLREPLLAWIRISEAQLDAICSAPPASWWRPRASMSTSGPRTG